MSDPAKRLNERHRMDYELAAKNNAFVKKQQKELAKYASKPAHMPEEAFGLSSYNSDSAKNVREFTRELTKGLDKVAFPIK